MDLKSIMEKVRNKNHILYDSIHMTFQKVQNYMGEKQTSGCQGLEKRVTVNRGFGGVMKLLYIECGCNLKIARLQDCIHLLTLTEHYTSKWNFIECKLYLNKPVIFFKKKALLSSLQFYLPLHFLPI